MQKITVKEVRGPLGKSDKKFYVVKDQKDAEFTTFDPKVLDLRQGTIINAEIVVDGKYNNLSKWEIVQEAPQTSHNGGGFKRDIDGITHEYTLRARLQELESRSIECQTIFNRVMEFLPRRPENKLSTEQDTLLDTLIGKALKWALVRLDEPPKIPQKSELKLKVEKPSEQESKFRHVGDFLGWCAKQHITKEMALEILEIQDKDLASLQLEAAHLTIQNWIQSQKEGKSEGSSESLFPDE